MSELIAARVHTRWSREHPSEYKEYLEGSREYARYLDRRMEGHAENPPEVDRIERKIQLFWDNPERKRLHQQLYLELADDLERLLEKSQTGRNE